jgi:hypothetical protein
MSSPVIPFPYLPTGLADSAKTGQNFEAISKYLRDVNGIITIDWTNLAVTRPSQPCFLSVNSAGALNVTGDGSGYTVPFPTEIFDQGGDFSANTFTAPVSGKYFLQASVLMTGIPAGATTSACRVITSNRTYNLRYKNLVGAEVTYQYSGSVISDMDAGDTAYVYIEINGSTLTADLYPDASYVFFSGSLIN